MTRRRWMSRLSLVVPLVVASSALHAQQSSMPPELPTQWEVPPGDALEHMTAGLAKVLCSALFITGRDLKTALDEDGFFVAPRAERAAVTKTVVDDKEKIVYLSLPNGVTRTAKLYGDQGCVALPRGSRSVFFTPVRVRSSLPDPTTQPWPMGDMPDKPDAPAVANLDAAKMTAAADAAFADPAAMTAAFLVVYKGRIVAERYATGITRETQLESWSMGKSLAATLFALLVKDGTYTLEQPAPVPLWRAPGDPRGTIRNIDLLRMSAGLKFLGNQEPGSTQTYPDHYYIYTGGIDAFDYSITRPQEYPPNTDGRYRNSDPLTITYLSKLAVTRRGDNFLTWPQRALFDRIGIRKQVLETDPYGNFLITGYDYGTARNWARLGLLYLQDGMWQGQRLLPEGWTSFVSTPAPAWKRPEYGGFFWLNRINTWNLPPETYFAAGAGGQNTWIVPSQQLVIVRMGHMRGQGPARRATNTALGLVMEAVTRTPSAAPPGWGGAW